MEANSNQSKSCSKYAIELIVGITIAVIAGIIIGEGRFHDWNPFGSLPIKTKTVASSTPVAPTPIPSQSNQSGPFQGQLVHNLNDDLAAYYPVDIISMDFYVRIKFFNPDVNGNLWDYGINFRTTAEKTFRLLVLSDSTWRFLSYNSSITETEKRFSTIASGSLLNILDVSRFGANEIKVIALGERGFFFLNDKFITILPLNSIMGDGSLSAITGGQNGNEYAGAVTYFQDFYITQLDNVAIGPFEGVIYHQPANEEIDCEDLSISSKNFIVKVSLSNPYDKVNLWSNGLVFRHFDSANYRIVIDSNQGWGLYLYQPQTIQTIKYQNSPYINVEQFASNTLEVIAIENQGYLFINSQYVDSLPISERQISGIIAPCTGLYPQSVMEGRVTNYSGFTVWPLP